jgi:TPR repeat protein
MLNLGYDYDRGLGLHVNHTKAFLWYHRAAAVGSGRGSLKATLKIARTYDKGLPGVHLNYGKAVKWFRKAAIMGSPAAMAKLGYMYRRGQGVKKNYFKAMKWFRKAAASGNVMAMDGIGDLYMEGWAVPQNFQKALKWYRDAIAHARRSKAARIAKKQIALINDIEGRGG